MAQSVKLNEEVMALVRREAKLQNRSVAGQISHWLSIGRAIELSGSYDHQHITAALEAALPPEALTAEEHEAWLDAFADKMAEPGPEEQAFFARRRQLGRGVGLSDTGEIVRESQPA